MCFDIYLSTEYENNGTGDIDQPKDIAAAKGYRPTKDHSLYAHQSNRVRDFEEVTGV
jgi:hypothetical protein